jgi:hypothetical protein
VSPRWRRLLPWLAPALLAGLASVQIVLARTLELTPWKGGGYGMFSTTDHGGFRSLRAFALEAGSERRLPIPAELRREAFRARDLPSPQRLEHLARALAGEAGEPTVRVEVWRLEFDHALRPARLRLGHAESGP